MQGRVPADKERMDKNIAKQRYIESEDGNQARGPKITAQGLDRPLTMQNLPVPDLAW